MSAFPAILKFGLAGLASIVVFFAYQLLKSESSKKTPNPSILQTIKAFMVLGVVLALIAGISSVTSLFANVEHRDEVHALEAKLHDADAQVERMKRDSAGSDEMARLKRELEDARAALAAVKGSEQAKEVSLRRLVADRLEQGLVRTQGKASVVPEARRGDTSHLLLRRAVFTNLAAFAADESVLRAAMGELAKRGHSEVSTYVEPIVQELPSLKTMRLRWLEDQAIPALAADIRDLQQHPTIQRGPSATVPLPGTFIIDKEKFGEVVETVTDPVALTAEVDLLKSSI